MAIECRCPGAGAGRGPPACTGNPGCDLRKSLSGSGDDCGESQRSDEQCPVGFPRSAGDADGFRGQAYSSGRQRAQLPLRSPKSAVQRTGGLALLPLRPLTTTIYAHIRGHNEELRRRRDGCSSEFP